MNLEEFNIIIFITGIIIGCVATLALKSYSAKNNSKKAGSSSNIITMKSLQQELDSKQVIIDNFFTDSNEQLMSVEKRLADLRNSLADNASQLSNIKVEKSTTNNADTTEEHTFTEPPRDYALKKDKEPGMLSETFGFDERNIDIEPKRTI